MLIDITFFIFLMIGLIVYSKTVSTGLEYFEQNINSHLPNVISSLTFSAYFISFYLRSYFKKKDSFQSHSIKNLSNPIISADNITNVGVPNPGIHSNNKNIFAGIHIVPVNIAIKRNIQSIAHPMIKPIFPNIVIKKGMASTISNS